MVTTNDVLLRILRNALWKDPLPEVPIPHDNLVMLMKAAEEQTVVGMVCSALMSPDNHFTIGSQDVAYLYATHSDVKEHNKAANAELQALCQLLNANNIHYVVVKGQTIAACYPAPLDRVSGDIDFYVHPNDFVRAKKIIDEQFLKEDGKWDASDNGNRNTEEPNQHIAFKRNHVHYEMHFCLMKFASLRNQRYFDNQVNKATLSPSIRWINSKQETAVPVLPPTLNLVYTFLHLYHHLVELGCGLRQFIDIAVLLSTQDIDSDELRRHLHALDMEHAFEHVLNIVRHPLGLPESFIPLDKNEEMEDKQNSKNKKNSVKEKKCENNKETKITREILNIIFTHGNFGFHHQKYAFRSGWRYYIDTTKRKLQHYWLFYKLSPREIRCSILYDIPRKIKDAFHREF